MAYAAVAPYESYGGIRCNSCSVADFPSIGGNAKIARPDRGLWYWQEWFMLLVIPPDRTLPRAVRRSVRLRTSGYLKRFAPMSAIPPVSAGFLQQTLVAALRATIFSLMHVPIAALTWKASRPFPSYQVTLIGTNQRGIQAPGGFLRNP